MHITLRAAPLGGHCYSFYNTDEEAKVSEVLINLPKRWEWRTESSLSIVKPCALSHLDVQPGMDRSAWT